MRVLIEAFVPALEKSANDIMDPFVIASQIFSPGTKMILVHLISEQQLNLNPN